MKAKKKDLMMLWSVLEALNQGVHPVKFSYFIAKNRSKLKDEIEILKKLGEPPKHYKEYDIRRAELAKSLADRDAEGKEIINGNSYSITTNKEEFDKRVDELKNEYEDAIKYFDERIKSYKEILQEELEFDGHTIGVENLPEKIEPALIELFINTGLLAD